MSNVHQIEFKRKEEQADVEVVIRELVSAIRHVVDVHVGSKASFQERETAALDLGNEATRRYFEEELQKMSNRYGEELLIDGILYKQSHEPKQGIYHSLCGPLNVERARYRPVGERNGATVVPLELEAGLVERSTPELGYSIALSTANKPSREYVEEMAAAHRSVPSRSTVDRIGKAVGTKALETAPQIERYLRQSEGAPEGAAAVSVGLDRTTVPFEEERPPEAPPKTRRKKRTKPYERQPRPPVDVNYHMAYVGTVSFLDGDGEVLVTRKYVATHHQGPAGIVHRMMMDVRAAKRCSPELTLGLMQDGGPEMWNVMRGALDAEPSVDSYLEGIDRYHLNERLGKVLRLTEQDAAVRDRMLTDWNDAFDTDDATIDRIERYIIDTALETDDDDIAEQLDAHLIFIDNNRDRLCYVSLREAGLPIGSGVTEGACKSAINMRAKRSGQRWHDKGVSAVLTLRAIHQSERLPRFWFHLRRRYCARVENIGAKILGFPKQKVTRS